MDSQLNGENGDKRQSLHQRVTALEREVRRMRGAWADWLPFFTMLQDREVVKQYNVTALLVHTVVVLSLLAAGVVLDLTGNDGSQLISAALAWGAAAGVQKVAS